MKAAILFILLRYKVCLTGESDEREWNRHENGRRFKNDGFIKELSINWEYQPSVHTVGLIWLQDHNKHDRVLKIKAPTVFTSVFKRIFHSLFDKTIFTLNITHSTRSPKVPSKVWHCEASFLLTHMDVWTSTRPSRKVSHATKMEWWPNKNGICN